jgi:PTH1 family peptidyl-tRNA hydrolase
LKAILGIGNPGSEYEGTRHNIGFRVVDALAAGGGAAFRRKDAGIVGEITVGSETVLLVKPQDYVNRTGRAYGLVRRGWDLAADEVLVVCDDFHLPLGTLRLRPAGSSGGHNGMQSILDAAGEEAVPRLRVGIGSPGRRDPADFVLSPFGRGERDAAEEAVGLAAEAADAWVRLGMDECMNRYNRRGEP